jgi:alpha-galactosidase
MKGRIALLLFLMAGTAARAGVSYDAANKIFRLDAKSVSYVFGVNEHGQLQSRHWGGRLAGTDVFAPSHSDLGNASFDVSSSTTEQEFPGWGAALFTEPALKVRFPDGNRDLVLRYVGHRIDGDRLVVSLKDIERDLDVDLTYEIDAGGILSRSARIENRTQGVVFVEQAAAAALTLAAHDDYSLRYLTGRWGGEWQLQEQKILPGKIMLESRRGSTGHQNNPWFAIERGAAHSENAGEVWFGALAWSGSWRITVESDQIRQVRITAGYNPFDFSYRLAPGESLQTPVLVAGYTDAGIGEASRMLHRYELAHVLPHSASASMSRLRPVLYNSWEATQFNVEEAGQIKLAQMAASIGVERFVMDDGWFGARANDHAGLGDWVVNRQKFPRGLAPLIAKVHELGMEFGLWVEPEMVNADSDLYRQHPGWVINFPGRPRTEARNQMILNLARKDVRDHLLQVLDELLTRNDIQFIKWDYNRNWSEPGWSEKPVDEQQKIYVAYVQNLYWILARLRERHPTVEFESCSGGGGRVDLGILHLVEQVWTSDNTDPFDRLSIQDGFTYAYTPAVMMAWVTDSPNFMNGRATSLQYRFLSSMQGSLGIGANLNNWSSDDFATARRLVKEYRGIRETVQHGSLYRLISPRNGSEYSATQSVAQDHTQAVLFAFLHSSSLHYPFPRVQLQGLDPALRYRPRSIAGLAAADTPASASGAYWMAHGIDLVLKGDFQAAGFVFEREP